MQKNDLKTAFTAKYPKYGSVIDMFCEANDCTPNWKNVTKLNLVRFIDYLSERLARSSVKTYCAMLKSVLSIYSEEVKLPKGYEKILSPKGDISQNTWLSDNEIKKLMAYLPENPTERLVQKQFIMGALTGARHSDFSRFTKSNIESGRLVYVSQKTHRKTEIPLAPVVETLLNDTDIRKSVSDPTFNTTLRNICRKCEINEIVKLYKAGEETEGEKWRFISSHTARRSFATNLYLRCHDIFLVSKLMGHSSVEMTATYIMTVGDFNADIKEYFAQFK